MLNCVLDSEYQNFMTKPTALQIKHRRVKALNFATVQALKFATEPELELSVLPSFYFCFLNLHGARKDLFGGGGVGSNAWQNQIRYLSVILTLFHPMDYSPPGSSVPGILQARILEWVAISFSRGYSRPRDGTQVFRIAGRFFTI